MTDSTSNHYQQGIETIIVLKSKLSPLEFQGFCKGNVIKYITRAGHKTPDPSSDYKKAAYYTNILINLKNDST